MGVARALPSNPWRVLTLGDVARLAGPEPIYYDPACWAAHRRGRQQHSLPERGQPLQLRRELLW